ncbi:MAG: hypothetical protein AAF747_10325 [Planctomycetota bacterium]
MQPTVTVTAEKETNRGWTSVVRINRDSVATDHTVHLSWVDHDHWSHGSKPPSDTVRALIEAVLAAEPIRELPMSFDASTARRWVADLDQQIAKRL